MGMAFRDEGKREVAGTPVRRLRMTMDVEKYMAFAGEARPDSEMASGIVSAVLGAEGLPVELAAKGDLVLMTGGGDDRMATLLGSRAPPAWFGRATEGVPGQLTFLCRVEVRGLLRGMKELMREVAPAPFAVASGDPVPVLLWGSVESRICRAGAVFDVGKLRAVVERPPR
jgi:hypothetical protein